MANVSGSVFRRILFWIHLSAGVAAGLFVLMMSVTGVLLTYESQLTDAAARSNRVVAAADATSLPLSRLAAMARDGEAPGARLSLILDADPAMPVTVSRGREGSTLRDPYTGAVVPDAAEGRRAFFRTMENWHRWLGGRPGSSGAQLMHAANLLFLFLTVSGLYLWFPEVLRWRTLQGLLLFRRRYINARFRDFSWHHVFGIWALVPLFVIALSGVVMSYPWANALVYAAYGEEVPQRRGPEGPGEGPRRERGEGGDQRERAPPPAGADLDALAAAAKAAVPGWQRLTIPLASRGATLQVVAELPSGAPRPARHTVVLDTGEARVLRIDTPATRPTSPGQQARTWFRFAHTGEQYGVVGQTLAGLASLAACFLVYTGLALAFRRLILKK